MASGQNHKKRCDCVGVFRMGKEFSVDSWERSTFKKLKKKNKLKAFFKMKSQTGRKKT